MTLTRREKVKLVYGAGICGIGAAVSFYWAATAKTVSSLGWYLMGGFIFLGAMCIPVGFALRSARRVGPPTAEDRISDTRLMSIILLAVSLVGFIGLNLAFTTDPHGWYYWITNPGIILALAIFGGLIVYCVRTLLVLAWIGRLGRN